MNSLLFNASLLKNIGRQLLKKEQTISVAESVTSGLLQFAFSTIEEAEKMYHGGLTAYNIAQKFKHLNVEPIHALACNCVSQPIAEQMALHVATHFHSHWGIGITGYATPVPESGNKVYAFYAICLDGKIRAKGKITPHKTTPPEPQVAYVNKVLEKLSKLISS